MVQSIWVVQNSRRRSSTERNVGVNVNTLAVDTLSLAPVNQIWRSRMRLIRAKGGKENISGIGVAVPGLVRREGTWGSEFKGMETDALGAAAERALGLPVIVESDRNAAVLGEAWCGAARGKSDAIVLMLGTGIGAGILSGGRPCAGCA